MAPSSTMMMIGVLLLVAASVSSTFVSLDNSSAQDELSNTQEQFNFAKSAAAHHQNELLDDLSDHGDTHDDGNDDEYVLINVTEFVARVRGGIKQAKRIAKKYNLKLIRRVSSRLSRYPRN